MLISNEVSTLVLGAACISYHQAGHPVIYTWVPVGLQEGLGLWNQSQEKAQDKSPSRSWASFLLPSDYSLKNVQDCAKNDFKIGATIKKVNVKLGVSVDKCEGILNEIKGE